MRLLLSAVFLLLTASVAHAQVVLQNFEVSLKYDECWAGENVDRITGGVALEGQYRLQTGPLNKNNSAYYMTPYIQMRANGFVRFVHRNESTGGHANPTVYVDLIATDGSFAGTIYTFTHPDNDQRYVVQPQVPQDGTYRIRFRFAGDSGNERVGLDELNIDGTVASTGPPQCGPVTPGVDPPVAVPDAATSLAGAPVIVRPVDNDQQRAYPIDRGTVDLQPESETTISRSRDIRDATGRIVGRAVVDQNGLVTVTPEPVFTGALTVPYSVRDTEGHVSNIANMVITVQGTSLDLRVLMTPLPSAEVGAAVQYVTEVANLGPGASSQASVRLTANAALGSLSAGCTGTYALSCGTPQLSGGAITIPLTGLAAGTSVTVRLNATILAGQGATAIVSSTVAATAPDVDLNQGNNSASVSTQIQAPPPGNDVAIAIQGTTSVVPGHGVSYTTTLTNLGPGAASNVQASVQVPAGLTLTAVSGACSATPCTIASIPVGGQTAVTWSYSTAVPNGTIQPIPPFNVVATAQVANDPVLQNNAASTQTQVNTALDVAVTITPDTSFTPVGDPAEVFVLVRNAGPNPARNFTVTISLAPELVPLIALTRRGAVTASGVWSIPEIPAGEQAELLVRLRPTALGPFLVRAVATPPPTDTSANNDEARAIVTGTPSADLGVRWETGTPVPPVGTTASLTLYAGNLGPTATTGARVAVELPPGVSLVSATPGKGTYTPSAGVWHIGPLVPNELVTMTVVVTVNATGAQPFAAEIGTDGGTPDPDPTNNRHTLALGVVAAADLSVALEADIPSPVVGQLVNIRATVLNGGPSVASAAAVDFTVGGALTAVSISASSGSLSGARWTIGDLAVGGRATLDAVVRVDASGPIPIMGTAGSPTFDPDTANNVAQVTLSGVDPTGRVVMDFEDLTGSESCWAWPGMAPGGFTSGGVPFGRIQANPPMQLLVQLVSSQLSGGINRVVSPWIDMVGGGAIQFTTKVTNLTSTPTVRVFLEDIATRTPILIFEGVYPATPAGGVRQVIPITVTGTYRVRWEFAGTGGASRVAIDDIVIDGQQVGDTGAPGRPVPPIDCHPDIPGNLPPIAVPDFATTPMGTPVAVPLLANDRDLDGTLNPALVDLDPTGSLGETTEWDIFKPDGTLIGRAVYTAASQLLTFTPEAGASGTAEIPYTVSDNAGEVSNLSQVTILVGSGRADVSVSLSAPAAADELSALSYTLLVQNLGPDLAIPVAVSHQFTGTTVQGATCSVSTGAAVCGNGIMAGPNFVMQIPAMAAGSAVTIVIEAIAPATAGSVSGSAQVQVVAPVTDPVMTNNTASALTQIAGGAPPAMADLQVYTVGPLEAAVGQHVNILATVTNQGPNDAQGVIFDHPTPAGFRLVAVAGACQVDPCALGTLTVGQTRVIIYDYVALLPPGGAISYQVNSNSTVSSTTLDPNPSNNSARVVTRAYLAADLAITGTQAPSAILGQRSVLTFSVVNTGPSLAPGVRVATVIAPGLAIVSAVASRGSYDPATGVWTIGTMVDDETVDLTLVTGVNTTGSLVSSATVSGSPDIDTTPANDAVSLNTIANPAADIGLLSSADNVSPLAGDIVTLTLQATNSGPSGSSGLEVTGVLPAGLTYLSHTASQGTLDTATAVWLVGPLAVGASATLAVQVRVERSGTYNTSAAITTAGEFDPVQSNNTTGVLLNAGATADVGGEISITPSQAHVGETVAIRGVVTNYGPSDATNVFANYVLPVGLRVTGFTVDAGTVANGRWAIPTLAVGQSAVLDATAVLETTGALTVTATITHAEPDPNPVNNNALATVNASGTADLRLSMVAGTPNPFISDNTTVYVVLTNEAASTSDPVRIQVTRDPLLNPVSALASHGTYDLAAGTWMVGPVPAGGAATLALVLRVADAGLLRVSSTIVDPVIPSFPGHPTTAAVSLEVFDPLRTVADLQVAVSATARVPTAGQATVVALAQNAGSTYALDLTMSVAVPAGARFVAATPSFGATCTLPPVGGAGAVQCVWPGQSVVGIARLRAIALTVQADPGLPDGSRLSFAAQATSVTVDPFPANNAAQATTVVSDSTTTADIAISKTFEDGSSIVSIATGAVARYRVTASNTGPVAATDVRVQETVPAGVSVIAAAPSQGTVDAATGTWLVGAVAAGASATLDIAIGSAEPARGDLVSTRIASDPVDANPANDRASIMLDVFPAAGGGRFVATGNVDGTGANEIITGSGMFEPAQLRVFTGSGQIRNVFYPYDPRFEGGVRVASCDIDGDGRDEVVTGAGPGGGPHIRVFRVYAADRIVEQNSWYAFEPTYSGGIYVACGDLTGDGVPEVVAGSGNLGEARVRAWEVRPFYIREIVAFRPFTHTTPEARVAVCDLTGDGRKEILATSGPGSPAQVVGVAPANGSVLGRFTALGGLTTGAFVACGDLTPLVPGAELAVSADAGGPPLMEFYSATGAPLASTLADTADVNGGVRVAVGDVDAGAGGEELIIGSGIGAVPRVRVASGFTGVLVELRSFVVPNVP